MCNAKKEVRKIEDTTRIRNAREALNCWEVAGRAEERTENENRKAKPKTERIRRRAANWHGLRSGGTDAANFHGGRFRPTVATGTARRRGGRRSGGDFRRLARANACEVAARLAASGGTANGGDWHTVADFRHGGDFEGRNGGDW